MKHDLKATANAFAVLIGVIYVICAGWVLVSRDAFIAFTNNWIHGINMEALPYTPPTLIGLVIGLVTAVLTAWMAGYLFARLYNYFAKSK